MSPDISLCTRSSSHHLVWQRVRPPSGDRAPTCAWIWKPSLIPCALFSGHFQLQLTPPLQGQHVTGAPGRQSRAADNVGCRQTGEPSQPLPVGGCGRAQHGRLCIHPQNA